MDYLQVLMYEEREQGALLYLEESFFQAFCSLTQLPSELQTLQEALQQSPLPSICMH